jgi:serine protease SohB
LEFLTDYGLFLAKVATFVIAVIIVASIVFSTVQREKEDHEGEGELRIRKLNDQYRKLKESIQARLMSEAERKDWQKQKKKEKKAEKKAAKAKSPKSDGQGDHAGNNARPRIYVIDFDGDIKASDTDTLRRSISAVLSVANPDTDEVVIRLESGGGLVHAYGLAAAQLDRIRSKGVRLTACVDKVAASGGYMMACVADRIVASPFAGACK